MLWNRKLSEGACIAVYQELVGTGVTPTAAYYAVGEELDEIQGDLLAADLPANAVVSLLQWWFCEVDYLEILEAT